MSEDRPDSSEPFDALANPVRLHIIRVLGEAMAGQEHTPQAFSELQTAVGIEDNGQFSYHLGKLVGRFVEKTDEGYRLLPSGIGVFQAVSAGAFEVGLTLPPRLQDDPCDSCDGTTSVWYENGRVYSGCHDCEDTGVAYPIPPGMFDPDDPTDMADAMSDRIKRDLRSFLRGVCPYCSGSVTADVVDEPGEDIDNDWGAYSLFACERCYWFLHSSLGVAHREHPAVISFYYERGTDIQAIRPWNDPYGCSVREVGDGPRRFTLTYHHEADARTLVIDDSLDVLDVYDGMPDEQAETPTAEH